MERPPSMSRADSTRMATPTYQRPPSRPMSSRVFAGAPPKPAGGSAVRHRPVAYDYATGSTFSVKINGKPMFLLNDFRKKVDGNVKNAKYVTAFKKALEQQVHDKKKQDAIRDQFDKGLVPRFRPVEHTDTGLTKNMLGLDPNANDDEEPPSQGDVGYSRIDKIDPWENASGGGLEKYSPCVTSVFAPVQYQNLDDTHPQWQREPATHLALDFIYGYQGASCWDQALFGEGPGMDNIHFVQAYNPDLSRMEHTGEILYFTAATVVVFDIKNNVQRYLHHSDDVTACTLLKRIVQKADGSWAEAETPIGSEAKEQWAKFFAYDKGIYEPNDQKWMPDSRLLPQSSDEFPQFDDGVPMDWRDWDLPNRCIVASGQKGRNPRIYVWRIVRHTGQLNMEKQVLATMTLGSKRLQVVSLSFNSRGNYLIGLANDFDHHICVFDWKNKGGPQLIREGKAHGGLVDTCKFNPYSEAAFASCGEKHLKMWELGDADLQVAAGLFGDLGEPLNQRTIAFNPRGNTITGVENGDIYVWSSGTVQAKYPSAHKENVVGLLYVDNIGLFSCGKGGFLKMWDHTLADTTRPKCVVDLKAFVIKGDPKLTAKISGRAMDWTTSETFLKYICDDAEVVNDPAKGVRGAPATHLAFKDIKADGCLMIGMTDNTILLLGFKKKGDGAGDWTRGMRPEENLEGYSLNSVEGPLSRQDFFSLNPNVKNVCSDTAKYGIEKGNLPLAVYWYQKFAPDQPGYIQTGSNDKSGCPWPWAVCGKKVVMRGHLQNVESVAVSPDERIFMSVSKDSTVRFYDIDDQRMIDCQYVFKPARSSAFWSERTPAGVVAKIVMKDNSTIPMCCAIGHEDGSFSVWKTDKTAAEAKAQEQFNQAPENMDKASCDPFFNPEDAFGGIHLLCSNPLPRPAPVPGMGISGARAPSEQALSIQYSPNGKYCVVALGDNCLDIYKHDIKLKEVQPSRNIMKEDSKQKALGMSDEEIERQTALPYQRVGCCNDHSSAVQCVDFDSESLYMRSVSQSRELLFAFIPSGKQCLKTEELSKKKWETHNCVLGWSVKSIWARGSQGDDVNSIDRTKDKVPPWAPCHGGKHPSPYPYPEGVGPNGSARPTDQMKTKNFPGEGDLSSWGHYVCATGDDFGKIKLFRWPAFGFKQAFRSYLGHGSHVMQVRFSYDDDYLMSAGGSDMSCFQWRHVIPNKIYVQNLPDAKNQDGTYKLPNHEMCEILKNFFSRFLKFDRDKEVTRTTNKDDALEEKLKKTMDFLGELSDKEKTRLRNLVYLQKEAWVGLNEKEEKKIPDREIVSVRVFNTGAKWEGKEFPSDKKGSKITSRWATVVFQSKDDVDDVIDVYGADLAFNYEKLFEEELCMLHPLYVEGAEAPDEKSIEYNREDPQDVVRLSKEKNPVNPGQNIYRTWKPLYKESDPKFKYQETSQHPPFLCITGYDPNESTMTTVVHNSMYKIAQDFKKRYEKSSEDLNWAKIKELWRDEESEWRLIQEWTVSDDKYGGGSNEFPNFKLWSMEQKQKLSGKG